MRKLLTIIISIIYITVFEYTIFQQRPIPLSYITKAANNKNTDILTAESPLRGDSAETTNTKILLELNPSKSTENKKLPPMYEIKATKSIEDILTIRNLSHETAYTIKVYAVDSIQGEGANIAFQLENKPRNHVGKWTTFRENIFTIEPDKTIFIPYKIEIPEKATPGTYQGGLIAEIFPNEQTDLPNKQIQIRTRLVEPILISIPGRKNINYSIENFSINTKNKNPFFHFNIKNNGNVILFGNVKLNIIGTLLKDPHTTVINDITILQKESSNHTINFTNPPLFGQYEANLEVEIYEYNLATGQKIPIEKISRKTHFSIIPWKYIIILIISVTTILITKKIHKNHKKLKIFP